jgi:hypothetical protein
MSDPPVAQQLQQAAQAMQQFEGQSPVVTQVLQYGAQAVLQEVLGDLGHTHHLLQGTSGSSVDGRVIINQCPEQQGRDLVPETFGLLLQESAAKHNTAGSAQGYPILEHMKS